MADLPRILCVDDEENILKAIVRSLRKGYDITTAGSGREALDVLARAEAPFPVIVSDMRMPGMNGAAFLEEARRIHPDSVRLLLTGYADLDTVIAAVNKGHIHRFLGKPCPAETLHHALQDALRQHELVTGERVLLERTLKGAVGAMADILAAANPAAFGHAGRIRALATQLVTAAGQEAGWDLEVAAMLSQLGSVALPPDAAARYYRGDTLSGREAEMVARIPAVTAAILGGIPRLETVLAMVGPEPADAAARGQAADHARAERIRVARAALHVAGDAERLRAAGWPAVKVRDWLRAHKDDYDEDLLRRFEDLADEDEGLAPVRGVSVLELRVGMVLTEDVRTEAGLLLVAAGQEVTVGLLERITNFHRTNGLKEPLWIRNPLLEPAAAAAAPEPAAV
jgi:CheY-like chemotaxis protein